jgi:hypothetical protein
MTMTDYRFRKMPPTFRAELRTIKRWWRARGAKRKAIVAAFKVDGRGVHYPPVCYSDFPSNMKRAYDSWALAVVAHQYAKARRLAKAAS